MNCRMSLAPALTPLLLLLVGAVAATAGLPGGHGLTVRVIDKATREPIAGAKLQIRLAGRELEQATDDAGTSRVALRVPDPAEFWVIVSKAGYVPRRVHWGAYRLGETAPASFTFAMEPGITIGGVVKDKAGKPVGGAELSVTAFGFGKPGADHHFLSDRRVTTGPAGGWRCDGTPADLSSLLIYFVRPPAVAYTSTMLGTAAGTIEPSADTSMPEKLKAFTAELVIPDRARVPLTVVGPDDKPVAAAAAVTSAGTMLSDETDASGQLMLDPPASGDFVFLVRAPGFARQMVRRDRTTGHRPEPIRVKLRPGRTLRGRVIDGEGNPVAGASVLGTAEATADAEGRFTCPDLPDEPGSFTFNAEGFLPLADQPLVPGDDEHVVRLRRPTRVSGSVVDAQTGKPVEAFKLVPGGQVSAGQPVYMSREMAGAFAGGKFEANLHDDWYGRSVEKRFVRVEADGYVPAVSPAIPADREAFTHDFKLERGEGPKGIVLAPDRKPMAGVKVYVSTPEEVVYVSDGKVSEHAEYVSVTTDAEGRFTLPPQLGPYAVAVAHDAGFIVKTDDQLKRNPELLLMSWGRVEGVVKVGGKPAAGETMELDYRNSVYSDRGTVDFANEPVKTDAAGRYAFAYVGPVPAKLGRRMRSDDPTRPAPSRPTHQENVNAHPGETLTVNIGGTGVPLVGRVKPPADLAERAAGWTYTDLSELRLALPPMPVPENFGAMPEDEQAKWIRAYLESPEGEKIDQENFKRARFPVDVRPDGSFRVDDLPPGFYDLRLRALDPAKRSANSSGEEVAKASKLFVIPEKFAGERFDIGELTAEPLFNLPVGRDVPDFDVKTLDGRPLKLSDHRGKVVLLDFWATWCGPCLGDTPELKAVHEAFGKDDRFVLVSLSLDPEPQPAIDYVKKNELNWVHGFLGEWSKTKVPDQFGVRGIPAYFLIGPDGKLITRDLSGRNLKREVEAARQKLPAKSR